MRRRRRMLDERVDVPEADTEFRQRHPVEQMGRRIVRADIERDHRPERVHLTRRHLMSRMVRQTRIGGGDDGRVPVEIHGDGHAVLRVTGHSERQRLEPDVREPAIERARNASETSHERLESLNHPLRVAGDDGISDDRAVPVDVFGSGVNHNVGPEFEGTLGPPG